jgi:hypothetical protein
MSRFNSAPRLGDLIGQFRFSAGLVDLLFSARDDHVLVANLRVVLQAHGRGDGVVRVTHHLPTAAFAAAAANASVCQSNAVLLIEPLPTLETNGVVSGLIE